MHFDILRQTETYLGTGVTETYGPAQIQQPTMFDFKVGLGTYLGELTAFASGLALYDAGKNLEAISLFDTAAQVIGQPLAKELERPIRFYRGTNYAVLRRAVDAKPDLLAVVPDPNETDSDAMAILASLGHVAYNLGDYVEAKAYSERVLALARQLNDRLGEAQTLGNLGLVAYVQGDYLEPHLWRIRPLQGAS